MNRRSRREKRGGVTEWTKVRDWKSRVVQATVGSNPTLSATSRRGTL